MLNKCNQDMMMVAPTIANMVVDDVSSSICVMLNKAWDHIFLKLELQDIKQPLCPVWFYTKARLLPWYKMWATLAAMASCWIFISVDLICARQTASIESLCRVQTVSLSLCLSQPDSLSRCQATNEWITVSGSQHATQIHAHVHTGA